MGRPRIFKDKEDFINKFDKYLTQCEKKKHLPNVAGFCRYCKCSRETYYAQKNYFSDTYNEVDAFLEDAVINSEFRETRIKELYMKSKLNYSDKMQVDANSTGTFNIVFSDKLQKPSD